MNAYDLFDSIGIIVDAKLAQLNSNITVVATVTDISKRDQGIYSVTYDSAVFMANGADSSLKLGDLVYVGIPDKNYTNAYIICKKVQEEKLVKITAPFEGFIKELNIIPDESEYIINNENKNIMLTWGESEYCPFINYNNFNNLGLSLKVKLDTANINLSYGIRIIIETQEQINKQILKFRHALDLDINTILNGNYVPNSEIVIEKLFDINDIENITGLYAEVYSTTENVNITFSDINLWFGSLISDFDREELVLYTKEDTNYSSDNNNINRKIYLRWVRKEDDEFKVITSLTQDNIPPEASISWKHNGENITLTEGKWILETSPLNPYKDIEEYSATIVYNTIEAETALQYKGTLNFINISENKDIFSKNNKIKLTAPRTSFDNVYHPDGTILDFELTDNPDDYKVTLEVPDKNISPFLRPKDTSIKYQIRFLIPNNHTNLGLGIQKSDQVTWAEEKLSDDTNYKIIESVDNTVTPDNYQDYWITYSIGEFYSPLKNNNTITYEIIAFYNGKEIERFTRTLDISFRRSGICKTDYVLVPTITNEVGLPTRSIKMTNGILNIRMSLCNSDGIEEEITRNIEWEWYGRNQEDIPKLQIQQFDENKRSCRIVSNITKEDLTTHNFNYVLKATYNAYKNNMVRFSVSCLIPIGINTSLTDQDNYIIEYFGGPTQIVYDSNGGNPNFYSTDYKLFTSDKNLYGHGSIENATTISWTLKTPALGSQAGLYPHLEKRSNKYYLVAPSLYTKDADTGCVLEGRYGEQIMWIQPLVSWQSTSFSSYINDWSGSLKIDEAENTIMSARLGAGRKNDDGTFSGVLLGDWQEKIEDKTITTTGIYGYDKGAQSYGLKEDGTAFFGKNGEGRIEFDGNEGLIYSGNYNGQCKIIDLVNTNLNKTIQQGKIKFTNYEFDSITGNGSNIILHPYLLCALVENKTCNISFDVKIDLDYYRENDIDIRPPDMYCHTENYISLDQKDNYLEYNSITNNSGQIIHSYSGHIEFEYSNENIAEYYNITQHKMTAGGLLVFGFAGVSTLISSKGVLEIFNIQIIQNNHIIYNKGFGTASLTDLYPQYFIKTKLIDLEEDGSTEGTLLALKNGNFITNNARFRGHIEANSGTIGEWTIAKNQLVTNGAGLIGFLETSNIITEKLEMPQDYMEFIRGTVTELRLNLNKSTEIISWLKANNNILRFQATYSGINTADYFMTLFSFSQRNDDEKKILKEILSNIVEIDFSNLKYFYLSSYGDLNWIYYTKVKKIKLALGHNELSLLFVVPDSGLPVDAYSNVTYRYPTHSGRISRPIAIPKTLEKLIITDFSPNLTLNAGSFSGFSNVVLQNYGENYIDIDKKIFGYTGYVTAEDLFYYPEGIEIQGNFKIDDFRFFDIPTKDEYTNPKLQSGLRKLIIGDNVIFTKIPERMCYNAFYLTELKLPPTVRNIGREAFYNCSGLYNSITFLVEDSANEKIVLGEGCFIGCTALPYVLFPASMKKELSISYLRYFDYGQQLYYYDNEGPAGIYPGSKENSQIVMWAGKKTMPTLTDPAPFMVLASGDLVINSTYINDIIPYLASEIQYLLIENKNLISRIEKLEKQQGGQ